MEVEGGSALHPLMMTARSRQGEDSLDMGGDGEKRVGEDEETQRLFGTPTIGTQGPAGSRVPDLDNRQKLPRFGGEEDDGAGLCGYPADPDAPPDAVGPCPAVDVEMTAEDYASNPAAEAAAEAVVAARHAGWAGSSAMLDALEAAESAFEQHQAEEVKAAERHRQARLASLKGGHAAAVAAAEAALKPAAPGAARLAEWADAPGAPQPPDTPRKAAICEGTRERMIQAVFEALQTNPRYSSDPSRGVMHHAQAVEDALFKSSHSKQVYLSKVSNAVRLARTVPDVADIPRIASGEPRAVAEGHTAGEATPYVSGLTGYVIKPQM